MTLARLLTFCALLACLVLAAPAAADDSGGVAVETYGESGGGILARVAPQPAPPAPAAPVARPAQDEETPTTPEGEEQPEGQENGEQPLTEENGGTDGEETAGGGGGGGGTGGGETAGGFLPQTGLELAALSAIGLGLLLAGGALWPTSSWPPPRDRLSRSAPRR